MQIINDTLSFLKTLSFVDVVFFFAVLALMLLVIVLIYFLRENHIEEDNNITFKKDILNKKIDEASNSEMDSLKEITEALENAEPSAVNLNKYEEEQEERAIISYDELLKRKNDFAINYSEEETDTLINKVANIEKHSSHPISRAFNLKKKFTVTDFKTLDGMGIYGKINNKDYYLGNEKIILNLKIKNNYKKDYNFLIKNACSIIYIIENRKIIGLIGVRDVIRSDIKDIINKFYNNRINVIMLTGDNDITAKVIASELGIKKVIANVFPNMKANYVKKLVDSGRKVIMVGDGINDAPALATATIGVSVNDGTDVAMDSSDVILMNNDMSNILDLIVISKKAYKVIKQNLFWAFFYNLCMLPIAMGLLEKFGISMTPMFGSIAMIFSSLTVVFNSLRFGMVNK